MPRAPASTRRQILFWPEAQSGVTYRIPALLYLPRTHTFLAFAEQRCSVKDEDAKCLVLRRGRKQGASVKWGPIETLTAAVLPNHRTMNPCPVYEKDSGTVFLFFICVRQRVTEQHQIRTGRNAARLCNVASRDGGQTWSPLTDLTEQVIGEDLKKWATFAVGPGHGVQLSSGRLVIPAYTYYIHTRFCGIPVSCFTTPHSLIFYSDDQGQKWHKGKLLKGKSTVECEVAEVRDADRGPVLYCNARTPGKCRVVAFSRDRGVDFARPSQCTELCEPPHGCQGSVVSFLPTEEPAAVDGVEGTGPDVGEKTCLARCGNASSTTCHGATSWLVYSHPTSRRRRVNLGIYLNKTPLETSSWESPWVLYQGPCGYSDLAVCEESPPLFGCLFECGVVCPCEQIAFQFFTQQELESHGRSSSSEQQPETKMDVDQTGPYPRQEESPKALHLGATGGH
ncbi:PREDICTED: sialidase-3 [Gavialis gangeticus]|uniref:sialidase-3 n=1 Tax=Gavialis gangeticus TaxID=94835 RepID=UPI00092F8FA2|nr:PREDICTED: sialidase-3 [Gavialis gangeticus]